MFIEFISAPAPGPKIISVPQASAPQHCRKIITTKNFFFKKDGFAKKEIKLLRHKKARRQQT